MTREIQIAIDEVLLAGIEQQHWLDKNPHPPLSASYTAAVAFYGAPRAALSLWRLCKAVAALQIARDTAVAPAVSVEPLVAASDAPYA